MDLRAEIIRAFVLVLSGDADLWEIIFLSLYVSLSALLLASVFAIVAALALSLSDFYGRRGVIVMLNALMGLPPVFIGLLLYILLSRRGLFGFLDLLYQPAAMIAAQALLIFPIMAALATEAFSARYKIFRPLFDNFCVAYRHRGLYLFTQMRFRLVILFVAGLGRALSEVGAVIIVGGNIAHHTRTMTTAIVLETAQGNLGFALGLGLVLVGIGIVLNVMLMLGTGRLR